MSELEDLRQYKRDHFGVICEHGHHTRTADLLGDPNDPNWQCVHCVARAGRGTSGDTIEQAARTLAESDEDWLKQRGVHDFMAWDGLSAASREQYRSDARRLADCGLLATNQAHDANEQRDDAWARIAAALEICGSTADAAEERGDKATLADVTAIGCALTGNNMHPPYRHPSYLRMAESVKQKQARIEKALARLNSIAGGVYDMAEAFEAINDARAALSGTEDEGNQP